MRTLYTVGYLQPDAMATVQRLVAQGVMLLDIRYSPRSRRPEWSRKRLAERFEGRYRHAPALGNVNYRSPELPIQFVDTFDGLWSVLFWFVNKGYDVCLLCACADVSVCHRLLVAQCVQAVCLCDVVHL